MKKILILENEYEINRNYLGYLENHGYELLDLSDNFDDLYVFGLIFRSGVKIDKEILDKYRNIKFIFRVGVGLDNVDLDLCKSRGILVLNSQGSNSNSVADLALWGTLCLLRKTKEILTQNDVDKDRFEYIGSELGNQNVAILGFGDIGKKIYQRLKGFGINKFFVIDPFVSDKELLKYDYCNKYDNIVGVGENIDILYVCMPLNLDTKGYLNRNVLSNLNSSVKIINISRVGLVDINDLYDFMSRNKNAGLFMDVEIDDNQFCSLLKLANCIITPHIGAMTNEANEKMHRFEIDKILDL